MSAFDIWRSRPTRRTEQAVRRAIDWFFGRPACDALPVFGPRIGRTNFHRMWKSRAVADTFAFETRLEAPQLADKGSALRAGRLVHVSVGILDWRTTAIVSVAHRAAPAVR
jgi:hypothetical protein